MRQKLKKGKAWILSSLVAFLLCGCSSQMINEAKQREAMAEEQNVAAEQGIGLEQGTEVVQNEVEKVALYQGTYRSCILQEDEEYLYLCGSHRVSRINKETRTEEILWQNQKQVYQKQEDKNNVH